MATKSKRQRRIEARNKREEKKIFTIIGIVTLVLILLLYLGYRSM